jgi:Tol biopolymer transport system component
MHRLLLAFALALTCTAPPSVAAPSPSTIATPSSAPSATPSPPPPAGALTLAAAGDIRGDHALVLQIVSSQPPGGISQEPIPSQMRIWDVPLDGTTPRQLVSYTQGPRILLSDQFDPWAQLSPDGRQLALTDPVDMAGTGVLIVDLVAGTSRLIRTPTSAGNATWSPDGQRIAYRGFTVAGPLPKEAGLWIVPASGGAAEQIWTTDTAGGIRTTVYGWTEDGASIAFSKDLTDVSAVDVRTKVVTRISGPIHGIAWRAKRPSVALVADEPFAGPSPTAPRGAPGNVGRPGRLEVRDVTTAAPRTVYRYEDVGTLLWDPRWSPTSDEIIAHWICGAGAAERDELVIVDAVSGARRPQPVSGCVRSATWSRDGSKILYSGLESVRVRNADGSGDRELFRPSLPPGATQQVVGGVTAFAPR